MLRVTRIGRTDHAEHELLLAVVERAQRRYGRGCRAREVLSVCSDAELAMLPQSTRGFTRLCSRYEHQRAALGRCLRVRTRRGETVLEAYIASDFELRYAETAQLYRGWLELQAELERRPQAEINAAREAAAAALDVDCDELSWPCPWSRRPIVGRATEPQEKK